MKFTVSPDLYNAMDSSCIKQEAYCVGKVISLNWSIYFGLLSATCKVVSEVLKFYQGIIQKTCTLKITTFLSG